MKEAFSGVAETVGGEIWISLKDRMPEPYQWVLVYYVPELPFGSAARMEVNGVWPDHGSLDFARRFDGWVPTHWTPLPEPPKEGSDVEKGETP